jgi:hypothetical protein
MAPAIALAGLFSSVANLEKSWQNKELDEEPAAATRENFWNL